MLECIGSLTQDLPKQCLLEIKRNENNMKTPVRDGIRNTKRKIAIQLIQIFTSHDVLYLFWLKAARHTILIHGTARVASTRVAVESYCAGD